MTIRGLGVATVFLMGCAVGGVSSQLEVPKASAQQAALTRWEYYCLNGGEDVAPAANKLGDEGWEMVTVEHNAWCFKRPKM